MNVVATEEHVGDIERSVRTVKECTRCHIHQNPFERYTRIMVSGCVKKAIIDLNIVPSIDGLSENISLATMITGRVCPEYGELCKLNFGEYVQAYQRRGEMNTNRARCVGAIALFPSGNEQGR